jgi:methylglyoxal synthase
LSYNSTDKGEDKMIQDDFIFFKIDKKKHIALIAHDGKKQELVKWVDKNKDILKDHFLCGTGTTARLISEETGLPVKGYNSGPLGGDQQIGSRIVEGTIDFVVFLWDPLESQPHDPDVKALLRIAVVYDIPIANNLATADFLLTSKYMNEEYNRKVENFNKNMQTRIQKFSKSEAE